MKPKVAYATVMQSNVLICIQRVMGKNNIFIYILNTA